MSCCVIVSTCHLFDREYVSFRRKRQPVPRFIFLLRAIHFCFLFRSSLSFPRWFLLVSLLEPPRYKRMHFAARNHLEAITTESNSLARPVHLFNRCTKHFSETVTLKRRKHFSLHGIIVYQVIGPWRIQRWPKGFSARKSNVREIIGSIPFFLSFFLATSFLHRCDWYWLRSVASYGTSFLYRSTERRLCYDMENNSKESLRNQAAVHETPIASEWKEEKLNEQFLSCDFFTRYLRDRVISK